MKKETKEEKEDRVAREKSIEFVKDFPKRTKDGVLRTKKCKGAKPSNNGCYGSCVDCSKVDNK